MTYRKPYEPTPEQRAAMDRAKKGVGTSLHTFVEGRFRSEHGGEHVNRVHGEQHAPYHTRLVKS